MIGKHIDSEGHPIMVDVGGKAETSRMRKPKDG